MTVILREKEDKKRHHMHFFSLGYIINIHVTLKLKKNICIRRTGGNVLYCVLINVVGTHDHDGYKWGIGVGCKVEINDSLGHYIYWCTYKMVINDLLDDAEYEHTLQYAYVIAVRSSGRRLTKAYLHLATVAGA